MNRSMIRRALILMCGVLLVRTVSAQQCEVGMTLAYTFFLTGEPILVQFEAMNTTRDVIRIGGENASDKMFVEVAKGDLKSAQQPFNQMPIAGKFQLNPGQSFQHKVELDKWFSFLEEGKYFVRLILVHGEMRYESAIKSFDVVPGIPVKDGLQMFVGTQNLKRRFRLVFWHRNQADRLFLRIDDDPSGRVWDTIDLGDVMRSTPPKLDISPEGVVTLIHRATQDAFLRVVLWSLPNHLEVVERNTLLDPEISASQRVKSLYGEMADAGVKSEKKAWWKFW